MANETEPLLRWNVVAADQALSSADGNPPSDSHDLH